MEIRIYAQFLIGVALGIGFGAIKPKLGTEMKILGDAFIKLVKMIVAPVVFAKVQHVTQTHSILALVGAELGVGLAPQSAQRIMQRTLP